MDQKINYKTVKKNYPKGSVIILQGSTSRELNFLNEGSVEIRKCGENIRGFSEKEILSKSKRIGIIAGPSIFGVENLLNSTDHLNSFIALSDCAVTHYKVDNDNYIGFFKMNPPIAMNILMSMKDMAIKNLSNMNKYLNLLTQIEKTCDNFDLLFDYIEENKNNSIYAQFTSNGGIFPAKILPSFLTADNSTILGKSYGEKGYDPLNKFNIKKLEFYHNLIKSKPDSFIALIRVQMNIFIYLFDDLSQILNLLNSEIEKFVSRIFSKMNSFFSDQYSPFNKLVSIADKIRKHDHTDENLGKAIVTLCRNMDRDYKMLLGLEHTEVFSKYDILSRDTDTKVIQEKSKNAGKYKAMFKDSLKLIVDFAGFPGEKQQSIIKSTLEMNKIDMKDPTGKESRKIIEKMRNDFFDLYFAIFLKLMKTPQTIPDPVRMFLYFGFINETFLEDDQLETLFESMSIFMEKSSTEFPVITLFDYLTLIYTGDENPGLSMFGVDFNKALKDIKAKDNSPINDTPDGKVYYELHNMVKEGMRITHDTPRAAIPYLNSSSFKGSVSTLLNVPKKLDAFIKKITMVDFTLFFRELTWKIPGKSELIKKEVPPYMILTPGSGIRVQLWQELVNNIRSSRGRFIVPVIFNADLNKNLTYAYAYFRWELNKLIVGANWMDPVEGALVGAYYDYSQYYNKMSDLSLETKEEIRALFNKLKIDRDRFAHDYNLWINYEKDGIPKLNKVVRGIFYRHIPFTKDVREKLKLLPIFEEFYTKYNNIKAREIKSIEVRYHKYMQPDGKLPEDLQKYIEMIKG